MNIEEKLKIAYEALNELRELNPLRNDFDAYCYDLITYGLSETYNEEGESVKTNTPIKPTKYY
jgi:hypothetical protein